MGEGKGSVGVLESWSPGVLECWRIGKTNRRVIPHYSITSSLHHSPSLGHRSRGGWPEARLGQNVRKALSHCHFLQRKPRIPLSKMRFSSTGFPILRRRRRVT